MTNHTTKVCTKCRQEFPATKQYFATQTRSSDGLHSWCKKCNRERNRDWSRRNPDKVRANAKRFRERNPEYMRISVRKAEAKKPDYYRQKQRAWREANTDRVKAKRKIHYYENQQENIRKSVEWGRNNLDRRREAQRRYRQRHPDRKNSATRNYRAIKKSASGTHSAQDVELQYRSQRGLCWWCGKPMGNDCHVDHRIPLARGGSNDARNLCITHGKCNLRKNNKMPWEYNGRLL